MDAAAALKRLEEVSSQVEAAVIFDRGGNVIGSTLADAPRAQRLARAAVALLEEGDRRGESLAQLEVATPDGNVFLIAEQERAIGATTAPEPTVGLVFYDLKSCLRDLDREAA